MDSIIIKNEEQTLMVELVFLVFYCGSDFRRGIPSLVECIFLKGNAYYRGGRPRAMRPYLLIRVIFQAGDQVTSTLTSSIPSISFRRATISIGRLSAQLQAVSVKVMTTLQVPASSRWIS